MNNDQIPFSSFDNILFFLDHVLETKTETPSWQKDVSLRQKIKAGLFF